MQFIIQHNAVVIAVLVVIAAFVPSVHAESFAGTIIYSGRTCSGTPLVVSVISSVDCKEVECLIFIADGTTYASATTCEEINRQAYVADVFADSHYVMIETFANECKGFMGAVAFLATGECQVYDDQGANYFVAKANEDASASVGIYNDSSCTGTPFLGYEPDSEAVVKHSCYKNYSVIYTSGGSGFSGTDSHSASRTNFSSQASSNSGSLNNVSSSRDAVGTPTDSDGGSEGDGSTIESITEKSGGINTGAIIGIAVAYVILCTAACILCMDRIERFVRRLRLRRP